jgi:TldD protein
MSAASSDTLTSVSRFFLHNNGLDTALLGKVMDGMLGKGADYADLYFQHVISESWTLEESGVKDGSYSVTSGVGVRAVSGEKSGFSYSDQIDFPAIAQAATAASTIARGNASKSVPVQGIAVSPLYAGLSPLDSLSREQKVELLQRADRYARAADPRVEDVNVSLAGSWQQILVVASDGTLAADIRPLVRLNVSVILQQDGRRERGACGGGARRDYTMFDDATLRFYANEAVRMAQVNLDADDAPAGTMPVVVGAGWPGVLLHEAVGHGLEGDFNRKKTSNYSGRVGTLVASPLCTIVDDGTLPDLRGSLSMDDEGTPTAHTVLVENGVLQRYMQDKLNARLMGQPLTGNGRRESYAHLPMPRMTNTYLLAGKDDPADIIRSVKKGLYAVNFGGGQVDITSGKFTFAASEAYLIEDGKITRPVKGATLIGNGPEVLSKVSMLGHDLALDRGVGTCGKDGQSVPVGVGQPTLKVDELTVGGTR